MDVLHNWKHCTLRFTFRESLNMQLYLHVYKCNSSVMSQLYLWHNFFNLLFKIKQITYSLFSCKPKEQKSQNKFTYAQIRSIKFININIYIIFPHMHVHTHTHVWKAWLMTAYSYFILQILRNKLHLSLYRNVILFRVIQFLWGRGVGGGTKWPAHMLQHGNTANCGRYDIKCYMTIPSPTK